MNLGFCTNSNNQYKQPKKKPNLIIKRAQQESAYKNKYAGGF